MASVTSTVARKVPVNPAGTIQSTAGPVPTSLENDNTGWVLIEGLQSNTEYHYEVTTSDAPAGEERLRGHFRTLPASDEFSNEANPKGLFNFSFEFACGNNQDPAQGKGGAAS